MIPTPLILCAAIALGLAFLARIVDAISERINELLDRKQVDATNP
jgi:hypothetical protein